MTTIRQILAGTAAARPQATGRDLMLGPATPAPSGALLGARAGAVETAPPWRGQAELERRLAEDRAKRERWVKPLEWGLREIGVPLTEAARVAWPGTELGTQLLFRAMGPEDKRVYRAAAKRAWSGVPRIPEKVPDWVPLRGGTAMPGGGQPVLKPIGTLGKYAAGGQVGMAGFGAVGALEGAAGAVKRGRGPGGVAIEAATGGLAAMTVHMGFGLASRYLNPTKRWLRSLTPFERAAVKRGLNIGTRPTPYMEIPKEKATRAAAKALERGFISATKRRDQGMMEALARLRVRLNVPIQNPTFHRDLMEAAHGPVQPHPAGLLPSGAELHAGLPITKQSLLAIAKDTAGLSAKTATAVWNALGKHGGDVVKAAVAVGIQEGLARQLADAVGKVVSEAAPADLLGEEVRPTETQAGLWGERGVPATWQTIKGVEYVLTEDGKYATRADGTGALIAKEDTARLRADAEAVAPEGVIAMPPLAPGQEAAQIEIMGTWHPRFAEALERAADVLGGIVGERAGVLGENVPGTIPGIHDNPWFHNLSDQIDRAEVAGDYFRSLELHKQGIAEVERIVAQAAEAAPGEEVAPEVAEGAEVAPVPPAAVPTKEPAPPVREKVAPTAPEQALAEAVAGEEVPFDVIAGQERAAIAPESARVEDYMRGLSAPGLVQMLKSIGGPYGGTLLETKEVGVASKALTAAQKKRAAWEVEAKKDLKDATEGLAEAVDAGADEGRLLGILGRETRLVFGKGVPLGIEMQEGIEGVSPAVRKHFIHTKYAEKSKTPTMTIERLQMTWLDQLKLPASSPDVPSLSEVFGRVLAEIEDFEAARVMGRAPLDEQLRAAARNLSEEAEEALLAEADRGAKLGTAVWNAQVALVDAAAPYLMQEAGAVETIMVEVERQDIRAVAVAEQALRQAQLSRAVAERALERGEANIAEQVETVKAAARLSGVPHVLSVLKAVGKATTQEGVDAARARLAWALERHVTREHAKRASKLARRIESRARRGMFDPRDKAAAALVQMANDTSEAALVGQDLDFVKERERVLEEGLFDFDTANELAKSEAGREADKVALAMQGEAERDALGPIVDPAPGQTDVGVARRLADTVYKPLTTIEQTFGVAEGTADEWLKAHNYSLDVKGSTAERLFHEFSLGKENQSTGARAYYRLLRREDRWMDEAMSEATGIDRAKNYDAFLEWGAQPVALSLPDADEVELTVGEWVGLVNTARDRDGSMQVSLSLLKRSIDRLGNPFADGLSRADLAAVRAGLDSEDPGILKAADVYWKWHQNAERFREWSEAYHAIKGRWPEELQDYYPLHRDVPHTTPGMPTVPGVEETVSDRMAHAIREVDFMMERTADATRPLLIKSAEGDYVNHSRVGAALVAYGTPAKNIQKVLNAGDPSFLRWLERKVGRTEARDVFVDTVRHVLDTAGLSRGAGLEGNQTIDQLGHRAMTRLGHAVFVASPFPMANQLVGVFSKLSDPSSPTSVADFVRGMWDCVKHPKRYMQEVVELSPLVDHRVRHAPALYLFGSDAQARDRMSLGTLGRAIRRLKGYADKLFLARYGDSWTQGVRFRINYRYLRRQGIADAEARVKAARMTEQDIENQDFPAHAGSADATSRRARQSLFARGRSFAGQSPTSHLNIGIRLVNRFRRDHNPKALLLGLVGIALSLFMVALFGAVRTLARRREKRTLGGAAGVMGGELIGRSLGLAHGVRQIAGSVRYAYGGRVEVETLPALRPVGGFLSGVRQLYGAVDKMDSRRALKASRALLYNMSLISGVPVAGAVGMWKMLAGMLPEDVEEEKPDATDQGGLAWKASGGSAAAVEKMKAAGMTYAQARVALARVMREKGVKAKERFERLRMLRKTWRGQGKAAA
ncbi:MAG TPA: hypothetical protein VMY35_12245 [Phycisphaerae bacterium]|nr:hypothetical protein [Phycisphaerae bacterium]